jgi:hypothetical protein
VQLQALPSKLSNWSFKPRLHLLLLVLQIVLSQKPALQKRGVQLPPTLPKLVLKPKLRLLPLILLPRLLAPKQQSLPRRVQMPIMLQVLRLADSSVHQMDWILIVFALVKHSV